MDWANIIIEFIQNESLGPYKFKATNDGNFEISINEPHEWGTNDKKFRCNFSLKNINGEFEPVFHAFKAHARLGDEYSGHFFKFVKIIKGLKNITEARFFFLREYATNELVEYLKKKNSSGRCLHINIDNEEILTPFFMPQYFEKLDINYSKHAPFYDYLMMRKVSNESIERTKIFVNPIDKFVVFPIYEYGSLVGYLQRDITGKNIPWIKHYKKGFNPIWNLENVYQKQYVLVFEAIFDAIHFGSGVALDGAGSKKQMQTLMQYSFSKYILFFDNDDTGRPAKIRWADYLAEQGQNVYIFDYKGIQEKDFGLIVEHNTPVQLKDRIYPWDYKTKMLVKMGKVA